MKIEIEHIHSTKKKLKIEVSADEVSASFSAAYKEVNKKADIKGFRKGKIPPQVLDKFHGSDVVLESLNNLINKTYPQALKEHSLRPVLDPRFELKPLEKGKDYSFSVEVEVLPPVDVKDYKGIPLNKCPIDVSSAEIEESLKNLQAQRAELVSADEEASLEKGMIGLFDIEGSIEGKPFKGGTAKGYLIEVGSREIFPGFEEKAVGMKKGESCDMEVTLPQNHPDEALRLKKANFHVVLQNLHTKKLLPLDDEFAKDVGKANLEDLKNNLKEELVKKKEQDHRGHYIKDVVAHLLLQNKFDIPDGLIAQHLKQEEEISNPASTKDDNQQKGTPPSSRNEVEQRIRSEIILNFIAEKESIQVDPKAIERRLQQIALVTQKPLNEIHKRYTDRNHIQQLIQQLRLEKTLDFVIDNATFK